MGWVASKRARLEQQVAAKRPTIHEDTPTSRSEQMQQASADLWRPGKQSRMLRFTDLLDVDPAALPLQDLQDLHVSARQVIGPHLARSPLDRITLEKLAASVERQAQTARQLKNRLAGAQASEIVQAEVADLSDFLDDALLQLRRQIVRLQ